MAQREAMLWLKYILTTHPMLLIILNTLLSCYPTTGGALRNDSTLANVNSRRCQQTYENLTTQQVVRCKYVYERIPDEVMHTQGVPKKTKLLNSLIFRAKLIPLVHKN